jgi:hypothetical protein
MTLGDAKIVLEQNGIGLAAVIADPGVRDTLAAFIYKQNPPSQSLENNAIYIQSGQLMDLWVSPINLVQRDSIPTIN